LSLSSFLAGGLTSSLNSYWESTSDDGSVYAAHTPYTVFYKTTTNNITVSTTTLGPDDSCCGTCDVDYPQADILYWPVSTQNTWCLQFGATIPPPITIGTVDGSILPAVLPAPTGLPVASGLDKRAGPITAAPSKAPEHILRKRHARARRTHLPANESYAVGADGFTFTSPSIYVIFPVISATNECGQLGHVYTSLTESFAPGELSTVDGLGFTYGAFNAEDLPCPPSNGFETGLDINSQPASLNPAIMAFQSVYAKEVKPFVQLPERVTQLDPAWMSCGLSLINVGIDPPHALIPAENMAPGVTAVAPNPKPTPAAPQPKPDPPIPAPTPEPAPANPPQKANPAPAPAPAPVDPGQSGGTSQPFDPNNVIPAQFSQIHQVLQPSAQPQGPAANPAPVPVHPSSNNNGQKAPAVNPAPANNAGSSGQQHVPAGAPASPPAAQNADPTPAKNTNGNSNNPQPASTAPNMVVAQGQTLTENGASATIAGKPAVYSAGSIYYDSTPVAAPTAALGQQNPNPVVAGGVRFAPAVQANPQVNAAPVVAGGLSLTPVQIFDSYPPSANQAITAGGLTALPVEESPAPNTAPIVVGGVTMTPVLVPAAQIVSTRIMGGRPVPITVAPGAANPNPQAYVIAGHTVSRGGPSIMVSGTPVALPSAGGIAVDSNTFAAPAPAGSVVSLGAQQFTALPGGFVADGQTVQSGAPVNIAGSTASLGPGGLFYGGEVAAVAPLTPRSSVVTVGNQPFTVVPVAGGLAVNGQTIESGQSINEGGTAIAFGPLGLAIDSTTVPLSSLPTGTWSAAGQSVTPGPKGYFIDGTTVLPNQAITVSGTVISLNPSQIIIGSSTIPLPASEAASSVLTLKGQTLTALPNGGGYVDSGQTILPGSAAITISGTAISLASGESVIVIGSSTIPLATSSSNGLLTGAGETFTPLASGTVAIDGSTISIGGPPITDHGTVISLAASGLVVGDSVFAFPTPTFNSGDDKKGFVIDGQTLTPDGAAITISGTSISLGETALTIGTSTIPLASVTADGGIGGAILSGIGAQPQSSVTPFEGAGSSLAVPGWKRVMWGFLVALMALAII